MWIDDEITFWTYRIQWIFIYKKKFKCSINEQIQASPNGSFCIEPENIQHYVMECKKCQMQKPNQNLL